MSRLDELTLCRLVAARLCHDLGGLAGTLGGTLDLVGAAAAAEDAAMLDLTRETAQALRLRLRLYAAAFGGAAEDTDRSGLLALLQGAPSVPRAGFALDQLAPGALLPASLVPLVLGAALLGAEALPRGGVVHLGGDAVRGVTVWPQGRGAAWPHGVAAALLAAEAGPVPAEAAAGVTPRALLALWLPLVAAEAGRRLSLALPVGPGQDGAAPLVLAPR